MDSNKFHTPVAFIIFNRPETTKRVFAEIAKVKPPKLLVIADGPRPDRVGEADLCKTTRAIIENIDWKCEVLTNYSDINLGCKNRVASGLDWVFQQVPEAIILEDDCLPDQSFFPFCEELLDKYRDDERIAIISGDNFQFGQKRGNSSYYYSRYNHIWGWASWRRAWQHYDLQMSDWPIFRDNGYLDGMIQNKDECKYWNQVFQATFDNKIDTWDYQWTFSCWRQGMISILPSVNLISNLGFGADATHTHDTSIFANMEIKHISFPLNHPSIMLPHAEADAFTAQTMFIHSTTYTRILNKIKDILL